MSLALKLQLAEGFREVAPRRCGHRLLWEENGGFRLDETDFAATRDLGHLGGVDCPIAVDTARGLAWAYCCQYRLGVRDYSEIREFDLGTGRTRRLVRLGLHQWAIWLLAHWPDANSLLTLIATDTRAGAIHIRHHLAMIDLQQGSLHLVALPRDAFSPLAACARRHWLIFHGAEGTHHVSFTGRKLRTLPPGGPLGRGGDIHPQKPLALIGGDGLWLWNLEDGSLRRLRERGQYPRWTPDGRGCWFSESSSDLFHFDLETGAEKRLLRIAGNNFTEINYSRPIAADAEGRHLALPLTRLLKTDPNVRETSSMLARLHRLCVVDLEAREAWMSSGYARHLAWW
ncbi:MAG TPA: hypothetical protein VHC95_11120 [Opitutales bacterium]|nr:hypothetical protein [Opitutales bacterium]